MKTSHTIILILLLTGVVALVWYFANNKSNETQPTVELDLAPEIEVPQTLGEEIFEGSVSNIAEELPETNPFNAAKTNPFEDVYQNPFDN